MCPCTDLGGDELDGGLAVLALLKCWVEGVALPIKTVTQLLAPRSFKSFRTVHAAGGKDIHVHYLHACITCGTKKTPVILPNVQVTPKHAYSLNPMKSVG